MAENKYSETTFIGFSNALKGRYLIFYPSKILNQ